MSQAIIDYPDDLELVGEYAYALRATDPNRSAALLEPVRERLIAAGTEESLRTTALLAWHLRRSKPSEASELFDQVHGAYRSNGLSRSAALAELYSRRGELFMAIGQFDAALADYNEAITILEDIEVDHPVLALVMSDKAIVLRSQGDVAAAVQAYEAGVALAEQRFGDRPHETLDTALNNLAFARRIMGRYAESVELCRRALRMAEETKGPRSSAVSLRQSNLGISLALAGHIVEALEYADAGLATSQSLGGEQTHIKRHGARGRVLFLAGRRAEAALAFREAISEIERVGREPNAGDRALYSSLLAEALVEVGITGDLEEAGSLFTHADGELSSVFGSEHYLYAEHLIRFGKYLATVGKRDEAQARWVAAAGLLRSAMGDSHPHIQTIQVLLEGSDPS